MEGKPLKRSPKLLTLEGAQALLDEQESVRTISGRPRSLDSIPDYATKVKQYEYWLTLYADLLDVERKPFLFFHTDTAQRKKDEVNRMYGSEVATLSFGKREGHDSYRLQLDVAAIKETFKDILDEKGELLPLQQGIAA